MKRFKKIRVVIWFVLLIISGGVFAYGYGENDAPLFWGSILAQIIFQAAVRLEFHFDN